jgi:hypothetical protein
MNFAVFIEKNQPLLIAIIAAIIGFVGNLFIHKIKEKNENALFHIECEEIINTKVSFDKVILGEMANLIKIQAPIGDTGSKYIDIKEIYYCRYRIRNLSKKPLDKFGILIKNHPKFFWVNVNEGKNYKSPDWKKALIDSIEKEHEEIGFKDSTYYTIPFLNPFKETMQEVFLEISSYLPLSEIVIQGGAKGVKFKFVKDRNESDSESLSILKSLGYYFLFNFIILFIGVVIIINLS